MHFMCDTTSSIFACNVTAGTWQSTSMTCPDGDCYGTEPDAYCGDCDPGDTSCNGNELLTCNMQGLWPTAGTGMNCGATLGCYPGGGTAYCGVCTNGDEACSSGQESDCTSGLWQSGMSCGSNSCAGDRCGVCANNDTRCANATTLETCGSGAWGSTNCAMSMQVCATVSGTEGCHECDPGDTMCEDDLSSFEGTLYTCQSGGTWPNMGSACTDPMSMTPVSCSSATACGGCLNGTQECRTNMNGQIRVCANGAWGAYMNCAAANGCNAQGDACAPAGMGGTGGSTTTGASTTMGGSAGTSGMGGVGGATTTGSATTGG
jgi:hypothetical protein